MLKSSYFLLLFPLLAIAAYLIELRFEASLIARVPVSLDLSERQLSGLDKAIAAHTHYLWRNNEMLAQLIRPPQTKRIANFYMDKYEVNQKQYRQFLSWYKIHKPEAIRYLHNSQPVDYEFANPYASHKILGRLDVPAAGISFFEAHLYCRTSGGNLPSSAQWSAAAGGKEGRSYPWGEEFNNLPWRYSDPLLNIATPPEKRASHSTPENIFDLGNGLSEWTASFAADGRVLMRGGNNYNQPFELHSLTFIERPAPPSFRSRYSGFRCVYPWHRTMGKRKEFNKKLPWGGTSQTVLVASGEYPVGVSNRHYAPRLLSFLDDMEPNSLTTLLSIQPLDYQEQIRFSKYEISRHQYRSFLRDPFVRLGFYANTNEPRVHSYKPANWDEQLKQLDLPVTGVDWWSAYAFAAWAGGRLPSEEEWLYAYVGKDYTPYPWGESYLNGYGHLRDSQLDYFPEEPLAVKASANDNNTNGIVAMAGNVSEWTLSVEPYRGGINMIVKGGNYRLPGKTSTYYAYNAKVPLNHRSEAIGIRVVYDQ